MKAFGVVLVGMGLALLLFTILGLFFNTKDVVSPVPDSQGVRVILISPTK